MCSRQNYCHYHEEVDSCQNHSLLKFRLLVITDGSEPVWPSVGCKVSAGK